MEKGLRTMQEKIGIVLKWAYIVKLLWEENWLTEFLIQNLVLSYLKIGVLLLTAVALLKLTIVVMT